MHLIHNEDSAIFHNISHFKNAMAHIGFTLMNPIPSPTYISHLAKIVFCLGGTYAMMAFTQL
jgi:hypothetical protein